MPSITISSVIDAPIEKVWDRVRDFNGLPDWHPRMVESHIEGGKASTDIGCVRNFKVGSGATIREKLLAFSDDDHLVTYSIIEHPAPISNHTATLKLERVTDGEGETIATGMGQNVFQGGFDALKSHFAKA